MSKSIALAEDFGKLKRGDAFPVVKESKTTTIVDVKGRRVIVPNAKIVGKQGTPAPGLMDEDPTVPNAAVPPPQLVELTPHQEMVKDTFVLGEENLEDILEIYCNCSIEVCEKRDGKWVPK